MEKLPECHWTVLMKLMRHAKYCYEFIADNEVISHMFHAKQVVPFKTMSMPSSSHTSMLKYYRALAFGHNVFLWCHTDSDFSMSMAQIHLKGKDKYELDDDVVVFFFSNFGSCCSFATRWFPSFQCSYTTLCIVQMQARWQYPQHSHVSQDISCWHE